MYRHVGSIQQVAKNRLFIYRGEGGTDESHEVNGPLQFTVMGDKCLDITDVSTGE